MDDETMDETSTFQVDRKVGMSRQGPQLPHTCRRLVDRG